MESWSPSTTSQDRTRSWMGCLPSKAFKGEGHRLGSTPAAPTAAPPNGGQRITPTTAVPTPQAAKPTNKTGGTGTNDNMRSAAARAAEQRAESVSPAIGLSLTDQPGPHKTYPMTKLALILFSSKHEEERTPRIQTSESCPTNCRSRIGRQRYLQNRKGMSELPCVHSVLAFSHRLA